MRNWHQSPLSLAQLSANVRLARTILHIISFSLRKLLSRQDAAEAGGGESPIAMLSVGGRGWIAGVIYIHNLIRAISLLPESERRPLCLILGPRGRIDDHSELEADQPPIEYYAYRKGSSNWRKSAAVGLNLVLGRVPCSLEYLTKRLRPSVLFPAQISLGRNFPVPWIGWIPDFQHRRLPHILFGWRKCQGAILSSGILCKMRIGLL